MFTGTKSTASMKFPGLLAGIYAASELFLGGIPTAMYTANLAAEVILA
jgi:flavin-dependent dehydrogenase